MAYGLSNSNVTDDVTQGRFWLQQLGVASGVATSALGGGQEFRMT